MLNELNYLTGIPDEVNKYGFCKVLAVRNETIHIKHIFTEIFVRKNINIEKYLSFLNMSLFDYMEIMTNRLRKVYKFSRQYINDCNNIVKDDGNKFFPTLKLLDGLKKTIVLDFDGVVTNNNFDCLYRLCVDREKTEICSANPQIDNGWFLKHNKPLPNKINSMKGKIRKIKRLIEIQKKNDYVFYVDDELRYLEFAWIFGFQTYHWDGRRIKKFSLNTQ